MAVLAAMVIAGVAVIAGWALSRQNSVWVYRYLAVVIGPLLLLLAAGLAEGGRTAVAALGMANASSHRCLIKRRNGVASRGSVPAKQTTSTWPSDKTASREDRIVTSGRPSSSRLVASRWSEDRASDTAPVVSV